MVDPDLKSAIRKVIVTGMDARQIKSAFDEGRFAFASGITRDECRFRNTAKRNAWERGWLESEREKIEHVGIATLSDADKAEIRLLRLSEIKALSDKK